VRPELSALARYLAEMYRDLGTITRLVEQAGLDASRLPLQNTSAINAWFAVCELAESETRLGGLLDLVASERPRNETLRRLRAEYEAALVRGAEPDLLPLPQPVIGGEPLRRPVRARRGMSDQEWHELATAVALIQQRQEMMIAEMEALHATVNTVMWIYGGGLLLLVIGMLVHVLV
jgi:hypothetical protein